MSSTASGETHDRPMPSRQNCNMLHSSSHHGRGSINVLSIANREAHRDHPCARFHICGRLCSVSRIAVRVILTPVVPRTNLHQISIKYSRKQGTSLTRNNNRACIQSHPQTKIPARIPRRNIEQELRKDYSIWIANDMYNIAAYPGRQCTFRQPNEKTRTVHKLE